MSYVSTSMLTAAFVMAACGGGDPKCAPPLVEDPVRGACACPPGSTPLGDGESCLFDDGGTDDAGERDAGPLDASLPDAGPRPDAPRTWYPWNGYRTGSVHGAANGTLRPTFEWDAVADATDYQIQLDDSCTSPGFAECAFDSPELDERTATTVFRPSSDLAVSMTAPVGRRYYWRVRGCRGEVCGEWSRVMYLNVGRTECDFNGDGYGDLPVGRSGLGITVHHGGTAGFSAMPANYWPDTTAFGAACGDVNADGFADLALYMDLASALGRVHLGSRDGVANDPSTQFDLPGFGVALLDLDGGGLDDLVVCDPMLAGPEGTTGGIVQRLTESMAMSTRLGDLVGVPVGGLIIGRTDIDADGLPDVLVSGEDIATVFFGGGTRLQRIADPNPELDLDFARTVSVWEGFVAIGATGTSGRVATHLYSTDGGSLVRVLRWNEGYRLAGFGAAKIGVERGFRVDPGIARLEADRLVIETRLGSPSDSYRGPLSGAVDANGDGFTELLVVSGEANPGALDGAIHVRDGRAPHASIQVLRNPQTDGPRGNFGDTLPL
ncbi:MAG: FG-GAP repeat protein [Sandaracinus sp.]|nr:FG-GAP repeat protein [Sandaracinus sp.]MCB9623564.1 FG-GAP repeat protein [Sandaracinus sp.]